VGVLVDGPGPILTLGERMSDWIELTGPQFERLENTVIKLFDLESFTRLLVFRLNFLLGARVAPGSFQQVVFSVLQLAQQEGWLGEFVLAVSEARPNHPQLEGLKSELGLGKSVVAADETALEAFVKGVGGLLDPEVLRTKLAAIEAAVCQISYTAPDGKPSGGTGFLVGPNVVMTNRHVMSVVEDQKVLAQ
jgi:hypothetical protein